MADRIVPLNPGGTLCPAFPATLPRPRDRAAMNHDDAFKALRALVTKYLMDVGIEEKAAETQVLPKVTPIHGLPSVLANGQVAPMRIAP